MNTIALSFFKQKWAKALLAFSLFFIVHAATAFEIPKLTTPVVDQTGTLTSSQKFELEGILHDFRNLHQSQIQVLIIPDLQGEEIESATIKIFDEWKLGDAKRDDGLLILLSMKEKRMRIEVGQGLEGAVPDVVAKRIIAEIMRPFFQRGEYFNGVKFGVLAVQSAISEDKLEQQLDAKQPQQTYNHGTGVYEKPPKDKVRPKRSSGLDIYVIGFIFFIWLIIFIISPSTGINILLIFLSRGSGRSGGGGSRGWGGGGGSSSGGGASGSW